MPLPRDGMVLDYSRWQQTLIGILQTDIAHNDEVSIEPHPIVTIDARLAYRNKGDADGDWKHYSSSLEQRELDCNVSAFQTSCMKKENNFHLLCYWSFAVVRQELLIMLHDTIVWIGFFASWLLFAKCSFARRFRT